MHEGEIVTLIGANGAGKSTLLRAISGLAPVAGGQLRFRDTDLRTLPAHRIVELGIAHVPEGRRLFANLTVLENLKLATWTRQDRGALRADYERIYALFPRLAERRNQLAGSLSGGEQQMLALGRALMTRGQLLLLDEPSMGLAPVLVQRHLPDTARDQCRRHHHPAGRAERPPGPRPRQQGIRAGNRRHHPHRSWPELLTDPRVNEAYLGYAGE